MNNSDVTRLNYMCDMTLQHTATHCNTLQHALQHTATHCSTLPHTATHCNTLQHTATHCNTTLDRQDHTQVQRDVTHSCVTWLIYMWHDSFRFDVPQLHVWHDIATHCNTLQFSATRCNTLQETATHCNTLQHTATYCNTTVDRQDHTQVQRDVTHSCATRLIYMWYHSFRCDVPQLHVWHDTATHCNTLQHTATLPSTDKTTRESSATWPIHVWHDSFICDMTHSNVTCLNYMCDMTL